MLDPADPSGSARPLVAAAHPHKKIHAAFTRGTSQSLGLGLNPFPFLPSILTLLLYFQRFRLESSTSAVKSRFSIHRGARTPPPPFSASLLTLLLFHILILHSPTRPKCFKSCLLYFPSLCYCTAENVKYLNKKCLVCTATI
jgi:hypothetical protein